MKSGDHCPRRCGGVMDIRSSRNNGKWQVRYLKCSRCGKTGTHAILAEYIRRRGHVTN